MFVRVRDFGVAHAALFPETSSGAQAFARVTAALAAIDQKQKDHMLGLAEARRVKKATRLFLESAATRQKDLERFGLPPTFLADFQARVDQLQQASEVRISSRTVRSRAQPGTRRRWPKG